MLKWPKLGSDKRRVIIDLYWLQGQSVNAGVATNKYLESEFTLKCPSIDDIVQYDVLRGNCLLFKIEMRISSMQTRSERYTTYGSAWNGKFYVDISIPFGYHHGSLACQRVTDAIRYIVHQKGFQIFNNIDDFIGCEPPARDRDSF